MPITVLAEEAVTAFGSEEYQADMNGGVFPIGMYIRSNDLIGDYHVELRYDNTRLRYVEGATSENDGVLTVDGASDGDRVKVFLYFEPISGGEAGIIFEDAVVYTLGEEHTLMDIGELAFAPVKIAGEDTIGISFVEQLEELNTPQVGDEQTVEDVENIVPEIIEESLEETDETQTEEIETETSKYDSASAVYEQSKNIVVQDRKEKMVSVFYILVFCVIVLMIVLWICHAILGRRSKRMVEESEEEAIQFPFEFDTAHSQKSGSDEWAKVIRHDLDIKENAGQDVSQMQFKELSARSKFDDIEFVTIDLNDDEIIEFIDDDSDD